MRVLIASKFLHHVGGVETYVRRLANSLDARDVEVGLFGMTPPDGARLMDLPDVPMWLTRHRSFAKGSEDRLRSALMSVWSPEAGRRMREALEEFRPDIVHFHGTCYQLTPSVVKVTHDAGVPAVLTAHEFKLICANQTLFDDARRTVCTACVAGSATKKVLAPVGRSCMKGSRAVSTLGAVEGRVADRAWTQTDPRILAPSRFMQDRLVEDGWPKERIDYLDLPWRPQSQTPVLDQPGAERTHAVFLGRLAPNKGADRLLRAWATVAADHPSSRLRILGDGTERADLESRVATAGIPRVDFLGHCDADTVQRELAKAKVSVHPARWHENSPFSVRESLMAGVPVIVADLGGAPEMVGPASGWVVADDDELRGSLSEALHSDLAGSRRMHDEVCRRALTEEQHLSTLDEIYRDEMTT